MANIPIALTYPFRAWARTIIFKIRRDYPIDYKRLQFQVRRVQSLDDVETEDDSMGLWESSDLPKNRPGTLFIRTKWPSGRAYVKNTFMAVLVHELGHACGTIDDEKARTAPDDAWGRETVADMFVFKWGFSDLIKGRRKDRMSEGLKPGRTVLIGNVSYQLSPTFVWHAVPTRRSPT